MINNFSNKDKKLVLRALSYAFRYKKKMIALLFYSIGGIILSIIYPISWGRIIQNIATNNYANIYIPITYILAINFLGTIFVLRKNYLSSFINLNIIVDLKSSLFSKILNTTMKEFDNTSLGQFQSRLEGDVGILSNIITNNFINIIIDVMRLIILGVIIFEIDWILSLSILVLFPSSYLCFNYFGKKLRGKSEVFKNLNDKYYSFVYQTLSGIKFIKTYGIKENIRKKFTNISQELKNEQIGIDLLNLISQAFSQTLNYLSELIVIIIGIYFLYKGRLDITFFIAFTSYSSQFNNSLASLMSFNSKIQQALVSLERIFDMIDNYSFSEEKFGEKYIENLNGNIFFENVTFEYEENKQLIKNLKLSLEANKITAIVGKNGCGKTTILNLILRLYNPIEGKIYIGDIDIATVNEKTLRDNISIVHQDTFIFNLSIKENFEFICPNITIESIKENCKKVFIDNYIESLENKYNEIILENGKKMSGGQKQRLILALSIAKRGKILLLDEATSAIDKESKYFINKAIKNISKEKTVIVITHDISPALDVDQIIIMDDGKIISKGTHDEIYYSNNDYRQLYKYGL
ncbi:MAG: ABC transporter ATP-binding protein [Terrisporobacter sp.]|uniref:ABC transporter ATP-binding protein n=1 Tax=Clostridium sp. TaxID=1506 RepID=UPI0030307CAA